MKVCDAITGTLYVVSEENAAIYKINRFIEDLISHWLF